MFVVLAAVGLVGCSDQERTGADDGGVTAAPEAAETAPYTAATAPAVAPYVPGAADPVLQAELVEMGRQDQAERAGNPELPPGTKLGPPQDYARAVRLKEIVAVHGWPTYDLVGTDGASAAWLVAQHADDDVAFQQEALDRLRAAAAVGQGSRIEMAYLADRVAVNLRRPQTYGTQIRCAAGAPAPATSLIDEATVDALRADVGLGPLEQYYDELAMTCANEELDGQVVE